MRKVENDQGKCQRTRESCFVVVVVVHDDPYPASARGSKRRVTYLDIVCVGDGTTSATALDIAVAARTGARRGDELVDDEQEAEEGRCRRRGVSSDE